MARLWRRGNEEVEEAGFDHVAALWGLRDQDQERVGVDQLETMVHDLLGEELDDEVFDLLLGASRLIDERGNGGLPEPTAVAIGSAAGAGYLARRAERERMPAANRAPADLGRYLTEAGSSPTAAGGALASLAEQAARLASGEAIDPGPDDDFAPTTAIPGLAVDERRTLREQTLRLVVRSRLDGSLTTPEGEVADAHLDDFRRAWKYGYFLHSLEEASGRKTTSDQPLE